VQACVLQSCDHRLSSIACDAYWLHIPFANFPFTSPPVRHSVPSHFKRSLVRNYACDKDIFPYSLCVYSHIRCCQSPYLCINFTLHPVCIFTFLKVLASLSAHTKHVSCINKVCTITCICRKASSGMPNTILLVVRLNNTNRMRKSQEYFH